MPTSETRRIRRVIARRFGGKQTWKASATDGRRVGEGTGSSWRDAVGEAVRQVDDQHTRRTV